MASHLTAYEGTRVDPTIDIVVPANNTIRGRNSGSTVQDHVASELESQRHMFEAQAECLEARILVLEAENRGLSYAVSGHESRAGRELSNLRTQRQFEAESTLNSQEALKRHQSQLERALLEATARLDVLQRHERATQAALEQTRLDFGYARLEIASLNSTLESVWDEHMQREQAFKAEIASLKKDAPSGGPNALKAIPEFSSSAVKAARVVPAWLSSCQCEAATELAAEWEQLNDKLDAALLEAESNQFYMEQARASLQETSDAASLVRASLSAERAASQAKDARISQLLSKSQEEQAYMERSALESRSVRDSFVGVCTMLKAVNANHRTNHGLLQHKLHAQAARLRSQTHALEVAKFDAKTLRVRLEESQQEVRAAQHDALQTRAEMEKLQLDHLAKTEQVRQLSTQVAVLTDQIEILQESSGSETTAVKPVRSQKKMKAAVLEGKKERTPSQLLLDQTAPEISDNASYEEIWSNLQGLRTASVDTANQMRSLELHGKEIVDTLQVLELGQVDEHDDKEEAQFLMEAFEKQRAEVTRQLLAAQSDHAHMNELASLLEQRLVEMREGMETLITREQQTRADLKSTRNELAMSRIHTKETAKDLKNVTSELQQARMQVEQYRHLASSNVSASTSRQVSQEQSQGAVPSLDSGPGRRTNSGSRTLAANSNGKQPAEDASEGMLPAAPKGRLARHSESHASGVDQPGADAHAHFQTRGIRRRSLLEGTKKLEPRMDPGDEASNCGPRKVRKSMSSIMGVIMNPFGSQETDDMDVKRASNLVMSMCSDNFDIERELEKIDGPIHGGGRGHHSNNDYQVSAYIDWCTELLDLGTGWGSYLTVILVFVIALVAYQVDKWYPEFGPYCVALLSK
mmetsp:Transcript_14371/g.27552  ORF Transcript_14371/g.27552 Transcript_14371/m.27552 type:complete len:868 (+) Transcript_14371:207-2810(+)